jgi:protoheme IX farnesyltransferase
MSAAAGVARSAHSRAADFVQLAKPRITFLVTVSAMVGYIAGAARIDWGSLLHLLGGTGLVAGAAAAFNQLVERRTDALMHRTSDRPLPAGRLSSDSAAVFAFVLLAAGSAWLAVMANLLAAFLGAFTTASYVLLYTPLKRVTPLSTLIGAVPGAIPPMIGWAAARNDLAPGAWILFGIVFLWQMPHFLAIAMLYREDYARAGLRVLPVVQPDGVSTGRQAALYALLLLPVSLLPVLAGLAGKIYLVGALVLGLAFVYYSLRMAMRPEELVRSRELFRMSLAYLPALWLLLVLGRA